MQPNEHAIVTLAQVSPMGGTPVSNTQTRQEGSLVPRLSSFLSTEIAGKPGNKANQKASVLHFDL